MPRGTETYLGENRGDLRKVSRVAIDAGADLVVGSGPHVVRGAEFYRGRLVAYSTGNFVGYGGVFSVGGDLGVSAVLSVTLAGDGGFSGGRVIATRLTSEGIATTDPAGAAVRAMKELSRADFAANGASIGDDGTDSSPTRVRSRKRLCRILS